VPTSTRLPSPTTSSCSADYEVERSTVVVVFDAASGGFIEHVGALVVLVPLRVLENL
jgi:hypothetical protein